VFMTFYGQIYWFMLGGDREILRYNIKMIVLVSGKILKKEICYEKGFECNTYRFGSNRKFDCACR